MRASGARSLRGAKGAGHRASLEVDHADSHSALNASRPSSPIRKPVATRPEKRKERRMGECRRRQGFDICVFTANEASIACRP
jgi:hypothetical protein